MKINNNYVSWCCEPSQPVSATMDNISATDDKVSGESHVFYSGMFVETANDHAVLFLFVCGVFVLLFVCLSHFLFVFLFLFV